VRREKTGIPFCARRHNEQHQQYQQGGQATICRPTSQHHVAKATHHAYREWFGESTTTFVVLVAILNARTSHWILVCARRNSYNARCTVDRAREGHRTATRSVGPDDGLSMGWL
jgi:hypothetical protein